MEEKIEEQEATATPDLGNHELVNSAEASQCADAGPSSSPVEPIEQVEAIGEDDRTALVEALLFASSEPLSQQRIAEICKVEEEQVEASILELRQRYMEEASGFEIAAVAGQYQLRTRAAFAPYIRVMRAGRPRRLSTAALETLAIVAYRQPVVRSDVEKIRGVDVTPTLKTLLERNLVRIVGHQPSVGQPALYGTTDEFLKLFGLSSLSELPTLRDIKEFEQDPGESGEERQGDSDASVEEAIHDPAEEGVSA